MKRTETGHEQSQEASTSQWARLIRVRRERTEASLKKTSVSGPVGGRKCGQLGGHNFFFSFLFGKKYCSFQRGKKFPVPSRSFFTHLAAGPETEVFFSLA